MTLSINEEEQGKIISFAYMKIVNRFYDHKHLIHGMKEDLYQTGYMEIYRIAKEYTSTVETFGTYALYCILRAMAKDVLKELGHLMNREDDYDLSLLPDHVEALHFGVYMTDDLDHKIFKLLLEGYTIRDISKELGVRYQTVGERLLRVRDKLKEDSN